MNIREDLLDCLSGKDPDTSPPAVFTQSATVSQMEECGCYWPDAIYDPDKMAILAGQLHRQFGFSTAKVPFCLTSECESLGCTVDRGTISRQPSVISSPYRDVEDLLQMPELPDPSEYTSSARLQTTRQAGKILSSDGTLFTIGGCVDPSMITMQMMGAENYLMNLSMSPDTCIRWIDALTPLVSEEVRQLSEYVDDVQIVALADTDFTPPDHFDKLVGLPLRHIIRCSKSYVTVHSCGNILDTLTKLCDLGEQGLSVETDKDPAGIFDRYSSKVKLIGGISPTRNLLSNSPEDVKKSAKKYSEIGYPIIAPECGIPPNTPNANLRALANYNE